MNDHLYILWTTNDVNTAHLMVFMYAINSKLKGWWSEVTVIVWGASAKLAAEDQSIQDKMELARQSGVKISACIACATQFGVVEQLKALNLEVIPWGKPLTELLKNKASIITI